MINIESAARQSTEQKRLQNITRVAISGIREINKIATSNEEKILFTPWSAHGDIFFELYHLIGLDETNRLWDKVDQPD